MRQLSDIKNYDHARIQEEDFNIIRDTARGTYVEVGTFHGASSYAAAENAEIIYTIDIYDWKPKVSDDPKIIYFKGTSDDFAQKWRRGQIVDTVFVDGSHELLSIERDIKALVPLVKSGGLILFDDYVENSTGVWPAVNNFLRETGYEVVFNVSKNCNIIGIRKS